MRHSRRQWQTFIERLFTCASVCVCVARNANRKRSTMKWNACQHVLWLVVTQQNPIQRHVITQNTNCTNHAIHLRNDNNNEKHICGAHQTEVNQMHIAYTFSTYKPDGQQRQYRDKNWTNIAVYASNSKCLQNLVFCLIGSECDTSGRACMKR